MSKTYMDEETTLELPYTPHGRFIHIPPREPMADWRTDFGTMVEKTEIYVLEN